MNQHKGIVFATALVLMTSGVILLSHQRSHQKLGMPGVKTEQIGGGVNLHVLLPEQVEGYTSREIETAEIVTNTLPKDTSFGQRIYKAPDGFESVVNVVLMEIGRASCRERV